VADLGSVREIATQKDRSPGPEMLRFEVFEGPTSPTLQFTPDRASGLRCKLSQWSSGHMKVVLALYLLYMPSGITHNCFVRGRDPIHPP